MVSPEQLRPVEGIGAIALDARAAHVSERANWMRRRLLGMIVDAGQGHPGGDLSATDIVASLYFDILRIDPATLPRRSVTVS